jgi:hypothetical protein
MDNLIDGNWRMVSILNCIPGTLIFLSILIFIDESARLKLMQKKWIEG